MRLFVLPLPYGGAMRLQLLAPEHATVLILATTDGYVPTGRGDPNARVVHDDVLRWPTQPVLTWQPAPAGQGWYQVLDLDTAALIDGEAVTYTVFAPDLKVSGSGTPQCLLRTAAVLIRDIIRPRIEYHLQRALAARQFGTVTDIPVLEREALEKGHAIPAILLKERAVPDLSSGGETIGKGGQEVTLPGGVVGREFIRGARCTLDAFVLTDNPQHRATVGKWLYEVLHQDLPYFEAAGLSGTTVSRTDVHSVQPGMNVFGSEVTLECLTQIVTTQDVPERVADNGAVVRP
ncbi:hypothetical protein [Deinococcus sp. PEB2-67]